MASSDPEMVSWVRVAVAFILVFGLMAGMAFVMKYVAARGVRLPGMMSSTRRLHIVESLPLDVRRRLVIVRCDGNEHLLLLGANQDIVVEIRLKTPPTSGLETKSLS